MIDNILEMVRLGMSIEKIAQYISQQTIDDVRQLDGPDRNFLYRFIQIMPSKLRRDWFFVKTVEGIDVVRLSGA